MGKALYRWSVVALCWSIDREDEAGIGGKHQQMLWRVALGLADFNLLQFSGRNSSSRPMGQCELTVQ